MMEMFEKLSCWIRGHAWSEWVYKAPDTCLQQRFCIRCCAIDEKTNLDHPAWEQSGCTRTCQRCNTNVKAHDWDEWQGGERVCKKCGLKEVCEHHWVPDACGYDYCSNCKLETYTSVMG